ncbi:putative bifunctional diguanylate cyclase/phosphodiesterase [Phytoactinopolyspora halotolerans]|nr:EAL domain-containing protein [Phytoactinopolyspora halotolerans]
MDPETIHPLLKSLGEATSALSADVLASDGSVPVASWGSATEAGLRGAELTTMRDAIRELTSRVSAPDAADASAQTSIPGYGLIAHPLRTSNFVGGLCLVRAEQEPWTDNDRTILQMAARLCGSVMDSGDTAREHERRLDSLVSYVASELMSISAAEHPPTIARILEDLGRFFDVDVCYLRYNDPELRASVLVDQWPRRTEIPDPDPLGVVPWDTNDPVFRGIQNLREPYIARPGEETTNYQERVHAGSGVPEVSMAMVPLITEQTTRGVLGFVHFGDRVWRRSEVHALKAIASLLTQVDGRVIAEEQLRHRAYHDELTGLPNRRAFVDDVTAILKEDSEAQVAVLFVDMDRLKTVNDVLGHAIGDMFIKAVAKKLRESVRPDDLVARLAGDEFVVMLRGVSTSENAEHVARRLLDNLTHPLDIGGHVVSRSACIGISINGETSSTADEMLRNADVALLEAKKRGGDTVVSFNDDLHWRLLDRADLEFRLRSAIGDGEMRLHFQPEFDLRSGDLTALEALVRWEHPERGLISAGAFVSVIEEINLAADLGRWVLEEACRRLADWKAAADAKPPPVVRVNISAGELISTDFVGFVGTMLSRYGHAPKELGIEITESTVMRDLEDVLATLRGLRRLGVTIAIDDFGTGYSSLSHLKQLPVDVLKIDRSFVSGLANDSGDRAIVSAIVRLAEAFGLTTVAEGVEDPSAVAALLELGCHRAQGFLMSEPLPADEISRWLASPRDYLGSK